MLAVEASMLLCGGWLLVRVLGTQERRVSLLSTNRLVNWSVNGGEFGMLLVLIFFLGVIGQGLAYKLSAEALKTASDRAGLQVVVNGIGFQGFALLGWPVFYLMRRRLYRDHQLELPNSERPPHLTPGKLFQAGLGTLLIALPIVNLLSLGWTALLRLGGFSDAPQDLIGIFGGTRSPVVIVAMFAVACIVAPANEELIFRGAIYRFCRQKIGRTAALLISAVLFGAFHFNLAGFLPLAALGAVFALAYEATGDIRVPIVAHGLFNLNTIALILGGLADRT